MHSQKYWTARDSCRSGRRVSSSAAMLRSEPESRNKIPVNPHVIGTLELGTDPLRWLAVAASPRFSSRKQTSSSEFCKTWRKRSSVGRWERRDPMWEKLARHLNTDGTKANKIVFFSKKWSLRDQKWSRAVSQHLNEEASKKRNSEIDSRLEQNCEPSIVA